MSIIYRNSIGELRCQDCGSDRLGRVCNDCMEIVCSCSNHNDCPKRFQDNEDEEKRKYQDYLTSQDNQEDRANDYD